MLDGEGFLLVYSITERDSFKMIEPYHEQIVRVKDMDAVPVIVVGNKSDLEGERRVRTVGTSRLSAILPPSRSIFDWNNSAPARLHAIVRSCVFFSRLFHLQRAKRSQKSSDVDSLKHPPSWAST